MKKKYTFLWIDDDESRKRSLETLKKRLNVEGEFLNVSNKNITSEIDKIVSSKKFDLILIDHFLDSAQKSTQATIKTGSTVTEYIREKKADWPIIGITAAGKSTDIDTRKKSTYEDLLEVSSISDHYDLLLSIASSYRTLVKKRPKDNNALIKMLKAPKDVNEKLAVVIPEDIRKNYNDESLLINISKWIRRGLMSKPGFLYDDLWTATLLGLKRDSFAKVKHLFKNAEYNGIFFNKSNPKWWQSQVRQIIYSMFPDDKTSFPWQLGHNLDKISKKDYSICHVCDKEFPETVGYTDETANTAKPMHLRCSFVHPNFESTLYYDDIRMMEHAK